MDSESNSLPMTSNTTVTSTTSTAPPPVFSTTFTAPIVHFPTTVPTLPLTPATLNHDNNVAANSFSSGNWSSFARVSPAFTARVSGAKKKRSLSSSDESDYDERPVKRIMTRIRMGDGDGNDDDHAAADADDDDDDNIRDKRSEMDDDHDDNESDHIIDHQEEDEEDEDETGTSFFDLIKHFAHIEIPNFDPNKLESCPLCPNSFPLSIFADHVYECIKKLDDVEKREQERLDEQYARRLQQKEDSYAQRGSLFPNASMNVTDPFHRVRVFANNDTPLRPAPDTATECWHGANCQRLDSRHFARFHHPRVPCPNCFVEFEMLELNPHLNECLGEDGTVRPAMQSDDSNMQDNSELTRRSSSSMTVPTSELEVPPRVVLQPSPNSAITGAPFSLPRSSLSTLAASSAFSAVRETNLLDRSDSIISINGNEEDSDKSFVRSKGSPSPEIESNGNSNSGPLTIEQASAMAKSLLRAQSQSASSMVDNDSTLMHILDTFKQLGFTQENLNRMKEQSSNNKINASSAATISGSAQSSSSSLPSNGANHNESNVKNESPAKE